MRRCGQLGGACVDHTLLLCVFVLVGLLHGDMSQGDRDSVIGKFKRKEFPTLVATDVAGG